jgi:hypothetical protein
MKFKRLIPRILSNFQGWHTNRKIVVIESDDWGSIRMPSKEVYSYCLKKGYPVDQNIYTKYDALESEEDLQLLLNLLSSLKDKAGKNPIFTVNCLVANPNFDKIKQAGYEKYFYETVNETFNTYPKHSKSFEIWIKAQNEGLFLFQSHGREHLNVHRFLSDIKKGIKEAIFAFNLNMPGIFHLGNLAEGNNYIVPLEFETEFDRTQKNEIIRDGLLLFEKLFGYRSYSFIAGNYVWYDDIERVLHEEAVKQIQGSNVQLIPLGYYKGFREKNHFTGEKNILNQIYTVRNVFFEPSSNLNIDWVNKALKEINYAFMLKRPAIISTHRINYIGYIDEANRDRSLRLLQDLLSKILKRWPDVEFLSSAELGQIINNHKIFKYENRYSS